MRLFICGLALATAALAAPVRAETHETCTGYIDALPQTIIPAGTWCLRADLTTAGNGITVIVNTATVIDCRGHRITGTGGPTAPNTIGVYHFGGPPVTVRNCRIGGFKRGIEYQGPGRIVDNILEGNYAYGISANGGPTEIVGNTVLATGGTASGPASGISAGNVAVVSANTVDGVTSNGAGPAIGISVGGSASIVGNRIRRISATTTAYGIQVSGGTAIIERNHVAGATTGIACGNVSSVARDNTLAAIAVVVTNCTASNNLEIE